MVNRVVPKIKLILDLTKELVFVVILLIVFFITMNIWGHGDNQYFWAAALIAFSVIKIILLVSHTFRKLDKLIAFDHSFNHMLLLLAAIITIILLSFAIDYLCLSEIFPGAFSGLDHEQSLFSRFTDLLYFSIVTFTTVGYGDITPANPLAKLISVFEMVSSFIVIVFVISKYIKNN